MTEAASTSCITQHAICIIRHAAVDTTDIRDTMNSEEQSMPTNYLCILEHITSAPVLPNVMLMPTVMNLQSEWMAAANSGSLVQSRDCE